MKTKSATNLRFHPFMTNKIIEYAYSLCKTARRMFLASSSKLYWIEHTQELSGFLFYKIKDLKWNVKKIYHFLYNSVMVIKHVKGIYQINYDIKMDLTSKFENIQ